MTTRPCTAWHERILIGKCLHELVHLDPGVYEEDFSLSGGEGPSRLR